MKPLQILLIALPALAGCDGGDRDPPIVVGSKNFIEGIVLGEVATLRIKDAGHDVRHEKSMGDAAVYKALKRGNIDIYADYNGTLRRSIFNGRDVGSDGKLREALAADGIRMTAPLGFENKFAIGVRRETAARLGLSAVSDLAAHPELVFGFSETFMARGDGWPGLKSRYRLNPNNDVRGMSHELAYVALADGELDVMELYTTDAELSGGDIVSLEDDKGYFPEYQAVYLYRAELEERAPEVVELLKTFAGRISAERMQGMNAAVKLDEQEHAEVAAEYLNKEFNLDIRVDAAGRWSRLRTRTWEHLRLVLIAMALGVGAAVPLGVVAFRLPLLGRGVLGAVSVMQTVPSLALLALFVPLFGAIGTKPAVAALFCYSMLPIVRNTYAGFAGIAPPYRESAEALGLSSRAMLWRVELPLAAPSILAGVRIAAVLTIGFATLGAFISAGGYGQPILQGVRLQRPDLILEGAIPAALMAVTAEFLFEGVERLIVPAGLRRKPSH